MKQPLIWWRDLPKDEKKKIMDSNKIKVMTFEKIEQLYKNKC